MRILVACEFSGIVRDAFRRRGHFAVSCDLLPSEQPRGIHLQMPVEKALGDNPGDAWDMMIAFPPCTYLAVSGARYFAERHQQQAEALRFVQMLLDTDIKRIALENPVGVISTRIRKPDQIIQPWQFGEPESKKTCLWLKGLPLLVSTKLLPLPSSGRWENQTPSGQNRLGPSPDRARNRSRTYRGIAEAMAEQWGQE